MKQPARPDPPAGGERVLAQDQREQARKLFAYLDTQTTAIADTVYRNEVADYTCRKQFARERELFFRRGPLFVGLSCLLPRAGDYMTHDYAGVPMLLLRHEDGNLRAFLNVCRHRGARVADGAGQGVKRFLCPYHAWAYATDGRLIARPDERSFADIDSASCSLRELPVAEKYGMIYVSPTPGTGIDVDALLSGAQRDMAAYKVDAYHHYETRVLHQKINWKIVVDTFLETYHLQYLHRKTVDPILYSNMTTFDAFGRNLRMIAARRTIGELRAVPEAEWNLIPYTAIIYVLFPNTVFIMQGDHAETWHVFPDGDSTDDSITYISLYTPEKAETDSARRHWDRNMALLLATVENEDFPLSEGIQRGFYSGAQDAILFGRNEPSLQHFHKSVKAALAERNDLAP
jgi:phenylpropionate dioxygenase-like ring-hydroxylating dioxygenase large terminal subunit